MEVKVTGWSGERGRGIGRQGGLQTDRETERRR